MTESDSESKLDEMERNNLQKTISEVEAALVDSTPASRGIYENFLQNAKGRIGALDKKIKEAEKERETHSRDQVVIAQMAENEKALSAGERKTFSNFLGKGFFTKKDFGALESFYAKTWDRLSEDGKNTMSHRVWEGVRRDEYKFTELPETVREKELERAYQRLRGAPLDSLERTKIPAQDRDDFIRAFESGQRKDAADVLEREPFKEGMFRRDDNTQRSRSTTRHSQSEKLDAAQLVANAAEQSAQSPPSSTPRADIDLSGINLDGLKLKDTPASKSSSDIPSARTPSQTPQGANRS